MVVGKATPKESAPATHMLITARSVRRAGTVVDSRRWAAGCQTTGCRVTGGGERTEYRVYPRGMGVRSSDSHLPRLVVTSLRQSSMPMRSCSASEGRDERAEAGAVGASLAGSVQGCGGL